MAEIIEDRVKQTSTSIGIGDFTLTGSVAGYRTFASIMSVGDTFHGCIVAVDNNGAPTGDWETGYYTYSATNTISRTTVRASSATSNAPVSFSAGTKIVFLDLTAYQIKQFATATSTGQAATPYGQDASLYTSLTFQDEFSTTTIDTTKWQTDISYKVANATQNFQETNGNLDIWPQTDGTGAFFDRTWTTDTKFSQTYGYFEVEAKLPVGAGLNPRIGLYNNDQHEILIMSALSGAPSGLWSTSGLHPNDFAVTRTTNFSTPGDEMRAHDYATIPDLSSSFHKYAVRWDASSVQFFFDGVQVGSTISTTEMSVPMYIYLGLWMSTEETSPTVGSGTLSSTNKYTPQGIANAFQINYVRVWGLA